MEIVERNGQIILQIHKEIEQAIKATILFMAQELRPDLDRFEVLKQMERRANEYVGNMK